MIGSANGNDCMRNDSVPSVAVIPPSGDNAMSAFGAPGCGSSCRRRQCVYAGGVQRMQAIAPSAGCLGDPSARNRGVLGRHVRSIGTMRSNRSLV